MCLHAISRLFERIFAVTCRSRLYLLSLSFQRRSCSALKMSLFFLMLF